ncbi:hypothetical protein C7M84_017273 [Penaeus vannamei]|uniref:Uncharacterized protein n=1 Tax=Penaeus vannamei TaxID=6689 RepID=A0A423SKM0_PENVA|nr:hypothetical protein C7M84_017273 [Penaeus vannamei]
MAFPSTPLGLPSALRGTSFKPRTAADTQESPGGRGGVLTRGVPTNGEIKEANGQRRGPHPSSLSLILLLFPSFRLPSSSFLYSSSPPPSFPPSPLSLPFRLPPLQLLLPSRSHPAPPSPVSRQNSRFPFPFTFFSLSLFLPPPVLPFSNLSLSASLPSSSSSFPFPFASLPLSSSGAFPRSPFPSLRIGISMASAPSRDRAPHPRTKYTCFNVQVDHGRFSRPSLPLQGGHYSLSASLPLSFQSSSFPSLFFRFLLLSLFLPSSKLPSFFSNLPFSPCLPPLILLQLLSLFPFRLPPFLLQAPFPSFRLPPLLPFFLPPFQLLPFSNLPFPSSPSSLQASFSLLLPSSSSSFPFPFAFLLFLFFSFLLQLLPFSNPSPFALPPLPPPAPFPFPFRLPPLLLQLLSLPFASLPFLLQLLLFPSLSPSSLSSSSSFPSLSPPPLPPPAPFPSLSPPSPSSSSSFPFPFASLPSPPALFSPLAVSPVSKAIGNSWPPPPSRDARELYVQTVESRDYLRRLSRGLQQPVCFLHVASTGPAFPFPFPTLRLFLRVITTSNARRGFLQIRCPNPNQPIFLPTPPFIPSLPPSSNNFPPSLLLYFPLLSPLKPSLPLGLLLYSFFLPPQKSSLPPLIPYFPSSFKTFPPSSYNFHYSLL